MGKKRKRIIKLVKTEYRIGDIVPISAIYECSDCWNVTAFKKGERFLPCEECHDADDDQHWYRTNQVLHFVTKNLNTEFEQIETFSLKLADLIAETAGNIWFIYLHIIWFAWWIWVNTGHPSFGYVDFDPFPFGLMTMVVSLEAIFLSLFILISQNRQSQKSELRAELDYQTNLKTEKDVAEVLSILRLMQEEERLIEKRTSEVLEDANIILERTKKKKKGPKQKVREKKADQIMEDAGIETVEPAEEESEN
jgi:uncharacterized membrane protein